jgi:hypothetical protein
MSWIISARDQTSDRAAEEFWSAPSLGRAIRRRILDEPTRAVHRAVTFISVLGVSAAVRSRLIYMLERERSRYCNHPCLERGEFGVGAVVAA